MGKSSIWIIWGTENEGAFILVDILRCHLNSDTVHTASTHGHVHPSDTVQMLNWLTLMRLLLKPAELGQFIRTLLAVLLLPGEWALALYWYLALDWIFLLTPRRQKSSCRSTLEFLRGWTRSILKEAEKLLHFPIAVKSEWPHFSFWIILSLPEVPRKIKVTIETSGY